MKYILPALFLLLCCHPAQACITRILKAPDAVERYLRGKSADPALAALAESFQRDKAYYDATVLDYCTLRMGVNKAADDATAEADRQVMDILITKWQKIADAGTEPAAKACKTADDCKAFCKGAGEGRECMPDGMPTCEKGQCKCLLTCR